MKLTIIKKENYTDREKQLAFEFIFKDHYPKIKERAYKFFKDSAVAEELAVNIMNKVYNVMYTFDENIVNKASKKASFNHWVYIISKNYLLDMTKNLKVIKNKFNEKMLNHDSIYLYEIADKTFNSEENIIYCDKKKQIHFLISLIKNNKNRELMQKAYIDGLSYNEIVDSTGLTLGVVKSKLFRSREKIKTELKKLNFNSF